MKRITVLIGAGAMIEATGASTGKITKYVKRKCQECCFSNGTPVLTQFCKDYRDIQKIKRDTKRNQRKSKALKNGLCQKKINEVKEANFEDLLDMLEILADYAEKGTNTSSSVVLATLREQYKNVDHRLLFRTKELFIDSINNYIYRYDKAFKRKGTWMKMFFNNLISKEECVLDVFNLNYDTWIEQILEDYVDGFVPLDGYDDFSRFSGRVYLNSGERHTISHLHGQICFTDPDFRAEDVNRYACEEQEYTLYKYKNFDLANDYRKRHVRSDDKNQAGHNIFLTNIITGRMKTDKLLWSPMQIYMYGLIKALVENEELLIIGYGFGDQYINNLLFQYLQYHPSNKRIRMITLLKPEEFEHKVAIHGSPFHDVQSRFAQCMMHNTHWCSPFNRPENGCYVSHYRDDNIATVYLNGFQDFCNRYTAGEFFK